jgi:redox-sensitive bicupin YhaK (pirin superfamily)
MVDPYFSMIWGDAVPIVSPSPGATITAIAGAVGETTPPDPPPDSWARGDNGVEIWHVRLEAGAAVDLPAAQPGAHRVVYLFTEASVEIASDEVDGAALDGNHGAQLDPEAAPTISAADGGELLVLSGVPIGEPVAQHGPFVMNDRAGIEQAFRDYQRTQFGGWPWPADGPVHGAEKRRFSDLAQ